MKDMAIRLRYLPLSDVTEGMVLGAPLVLPEHGVSTFGLPMGHVLTETNLHQMAVRHAEFVCIQQEDTRSDDERAAEIAASEARVRHIFRSADLSQPLMARLYGAVLAYRGQ